MWPTLGVKFIFALVICTEMHIYVRAEWNSSDTTDFQAKPEQQTYGLYIERLENVIQKQSTIIENLQKSCESTRQSHWTLGKHLPEQRWE